MQQHVLGEAHAAHLLVHLVAPVEQLVAAQRAVECGLGEAGAARSLRRGAQLLELFAEGGRAALEGRQAARVLRVGSGEG